MDHKQSLWHVRQHKDCRFCSFQAWHGGRKRSSLTLSLWRSDGRLFHRRMRIQIRFEIWIPIDRNCYDWLKKYTVIEVVDTAFWRLCPAKVLFCCAQSPKWRAQPQIAVFVSEVVIAKGTLLRLCPVFWRNCFGCVRFLEVVPTLRSSLNTGVWYSTDIRA